jgi:hypothetical protein
VPAVSWGRFLHRLTAVSTAPDWSGSGDVVLGAHTTFGVFTRHLSHTLEMRTATAR